MGSLPLTIQRHAKNLVHYVLSDSYRSNIRPGLERELRCRVEAAMASFYSEILESLRQSDKETGCRELLSNLEIQRKASKNKTCTPNAEPRKQ